MEKSAENEMVLTEVEEPTVVLPPGQAEPPPTAQPQVAPQIGYDIPPNQPIQQQEYQQPQVNSISYMDFNPTIIDRAVGKKLAVYVRFEILIQSANQWLQGNPAFRVQSVETVMSHNAGRTSGIADTESSSYHESPRLNHYNRSLRVWIVPRTMYDPPGPSQMAYMNVVPLCLQPSGSVSDAQIEPLSVALDRTNARFSGNPLPGRIIQTETLTVACEDADGSVDPDLCFWVETGENLYYLQVLRIFYELGAIFIEEIGYKDIIPVLLSSQGTTNQYEEYSFCVTKAMEWIQREPTLRITNLQSVVYKLAVKGDRMKEESINTTQSMFRTRFGLKGKECSRFLRILRIYFTRPLAGTIPPGPPVLLTYRNFSPGQLKKGDPLADGYNTELQSRNGARLTAWCNATGARVISCETVPVRSFGKVSPEVTYFYNYGTMGERITFTLRIYMDGVYQEPPLHLLPPMPYEQQQSSSCDIL